MTPVGVFSNMLKYYKKVENYAGDFPSDHHGSSGPITVSRPKYSPGLQEWLEAGQELGFEVADPNGPQKVSYTPLEFSKRAGRRQSAYSEYLKSATSRSNLRVVTNAEVTQILFNGKVATAVKYQLTSDTKGATQDRIAKAKREIIISAGTFESAALLLRSGIGPKGILQNAGIPQIHEAPVGANLHDHPLLALTFGLNRKDAAFDPEADLNPESFAEFNRTGNGPYSTYGGLFGQAFLKSSESEPSPNIQMYWMGSTTGLPQEFQGKLSESNNSKIGVTVLVTVAKPKSRGTIILDPVNPKNFPIVDFKYYSNPEDTEVMISGIKAALNTFEKSTAFQKLGAIYSSTPLPACKKIQFGLDEYWKCFIGQMTTYGAHGVGSCKMGSGAEDKEAVVDSRLRIIGLHNIRVVDASIMPTITNSNVQAPVYAIAEKASEMIMEESSKGHDSARVDL